MLFTFACHAHHKAREMENSAAEDSIWKVRHPGVPHPSLMCRCNLILDLEEAAEANKTQRATYLHIPLRSCITIDNQRDMPGKWHIEETLRLIARNRAFFGH
jgi:hypothetical protein